MSGDKKRITNTVMVTFLKCIIALTIFYPTFGYLNLYVFRGLGVIFLLVLITIIDSVLIIIGIILLIKKKRNLLIIVGLCIVVSNWTSPYLIKPIHDYEIKITAERAGTIIRALDSYYKDNKSYPKDLNELPKQYLSQVPKTYHIAANGEEFEYYIDDKGDFILSYNKDPYFPVRYYSKYKQWYSETYY